MSRYTSLSFYRPDRPPRLTGADLASFVSAFAALELARETRSIDYHVKFGKAIDQDERPTDWDEPVAGTGGIISVSQNISYDAEGWNVPSLARLAEELGACRETIYRANLSLGAIKDEIFDRMKREPSEENEESLELDSWSLQIGPITSHQLSGEAVFMVGWIAVGMHGYGYLYPWSLSDLIDLAQACAPVRALTDLCRRTWPVAAQKPPRPVIKARQKMGELWPYPDTDRCWDWYWGLSESG